MSVKKHYEVMAHEVIEKVCVGETMTCDVCKKEILKGSGYWNVTTGHNDWGRDSIDSIEHFDICSEICLMSKFSDYLDESGGDDYNTEYIKIERDRW